MFHDDFRTGQSQINAHVVKPASMMMAVGFFDDNPAAYDTAMEILQLCGFFPNCGLHRVRWRHVSKSDVEWNINGSLSFQFTLADMGDTPFESPARKRLVHSSRSAAGKRSFLTACCSSCRIRSRVIGYPCRIASPTADSPTARLHSWRSCLRDAQHPRLIGHGSNHETVRPPAGLELRSMVYAKAQTAQTLRDPTVRGMGNKPVCPSSLHVCQRQWSI